MWRMQLITKEKMESFCKGELKYGGSNDEKSGDDDIEEFFDNLKMQKPTMSEFFHIIFQN